MSTSSPIKLSTSLFSLALEWNSGEYSLEQLLAKVKECSIGPGIEIVGFQSLRGFPYLTDEQIDEVNRIIEKYDFEPACLGADLDIALRRNSHLNNDESVAYLIPQIEVAKKLHFPVLCLPFSAQPAVIRKLLPVAERANVKLGLEIPSLLQVEQPAVLTFRELFEEIGSPYLGFVADFSTSMIKIPDTMLHGFRKAGVTDELIDITNEIWKKDTPAPSKFAELQERASASGATPPQLERLIMAFSMNGKQPVEAWKEIVPQTIHLHGKFYGIDENGDEPSIDYEAIIKVFYEGGYKGYLSSEYGTAFTDKYTGSGQVYRHQMLCARILKNLEANNPAKGDFLNQIKVANTIKY